MGQLGTMLVSHSHKFIFIKTKKTGGSSVEKIIVDNFFDPSIDVCTGSKTDGVPMHNIDHASGHIGWREIKSYVTDKQWNSYYKFTIERNPWDKVVSQYYWKTKNKPQDFSEWLSPNNRKLTTLSDWSRYSDGTKPVTDLVIEYSKLHTTLIKLFNEELDLELTQELLDNTKTKTGFKKKHYTELYQTQKQIDLVNKYFKNEINYYHYQYGVDYE
jgi:hypothetical protein